MGKKLTIDEMLEAMERMNHPRFGKHLGVALALADLMASEIGKELGVEVGDASYEGKDFGGLLVDFSASAPDQPLPDALKGLDDDEVWDGAKGAEADDATAPGRSFVFALGARYKVWKHRPIGIEIVRCSDGASLFVQGDGERALEDELEAAQRASEQGSLAVDPVDHVCAAFDDVLGAEVR